MKSRAAVLRGVGVDWEVTEVELDPPHAGEVLVKMAYAGICHSDEHFYTGDSVPSKEMEEMMRGAGVPVPEWFPMLGGHEGSGIVEDVGPGGGTLKPGDHVAISFFPACGNCRWCATGYTYLCDVGADIYSKNMITDGIPTAPPRRRGPHGDDAGGHVLRVCRGLRTLAGQGPRLDLAGGRVTGILRCDNGIRVGLGRRRHEDRRHRRRDRRRRHRHERGAGRRRSPAPSTSSPSTPSSSSVRSHRRSAPPTPRLTPVQRWNWSRRSPGV